MVTVALVGPDGAGKTTVARRLERELGLPVHYLYMGVSAASSDRMLPTTRLAHAVKRALGAAADTAGPPDPERVGGEDRGARDRGRLRAGTSGLRSGLRLANRLAEEWYRQALAWRLVRQGKVVIFDRHFFVDYHAYDIAPRAGRPLDRRLHGFVLAHLYPRPDLVVYLDAPAEVLLARKGEGTVEALERRRHDYLALASDVPDFAVVDATRPVDAVVADVADRIRTAVVAREAGGRASGSEPRALLVRKAARSGPVIEGRSGSARRALVTDAERGSAVAIIRSLGKHGWRVTAAAAHRDSPGMRSRYAHDRLRYPPPRSDAAAAAEAILAAVNARGIDLVVPVTDELILPLQAIRDQFAGACRLAIPESTALEVVRDKAATLRLAEGLDIPTPRGTIASSLEEAIAGAELVGWPVVIKPQVSRVVSGGRIHPLTVSFAGDRRELEKRLRPVVAFSPVLIQEYCPGEGHGVELLMHEGRPLAGFQHRRLREVPVTGGASAYRESVALDPTLCDQAARLLAALDWTGLAMVEFRVGPDGPRLMEVNGRIWGSLPLAVAAGMDFPARLADLLLDGPPADGAFDTAYRVGLRAHSLPLETSWILNVAGGRRRYDCLPFPQRQAALWAALTLLDPRAEFDVLSLQDPLPGVVELVDVARMIVERVRHGAD